MNRFINIPMNCIPDWFFQVREFMYETLISPVEYLIAKMYLVDIGVIVENCIRVW